MSPQQEGDANDKIDPSHGDIDQQTTSMLQQRGVATSQIQPGQTQAQAQTQSPTSVIENEDPLLIAQTLTFVTDDGSVMMSFAAAPFSFAFKLNFFIVEAVFVLLCLFAVPVGAHATVISISVGNLCAVAWFWYNSVRSVDITADGGLNFWIGNFEVSVPFDKIVSVKHVRARRVPCNILSCGLIPHRGYMSNPQDGVAILTSLPSTPFWTWPRALEGRTERVCCFGLFRCPRLVIVFSPAGGGVNFIREVENEITRQENGGGRKGNQQLQGFISPPVSIHVT